MRGADCRLRLRPIPTQHVGSAVGMSPFETAKLGA